MKHTYLLLLSMCLTGCMGQKIANTKQMDDRLLIQASQSNQSAAQACQQAGKAIEAGNTKKLHYFSPLHMEQAEDSYAAARDAYKSSDPLRKNQALINCLKVQKLITDGSAIKTRALTSLKPSFFQLDRLRKVDKSLKFSSDIQDHVDDVRDLIKTIEAGKLNEATQDQVVLMADMQELEIEIVLSKHMPAIEFSLDQADDIHAEKFAEQTYEKAEQEIDLAVEVIKQNYRNDKAVKSAADKAVLACKHAYFVAQEARKLKGLKPDLAENYVLHIESLLDRINTSLGLAPVYGQSLYSQSVAIAKAGEAIRVQQVK